MPWYVSPSDIQNARKSMDRKQLDDARRDLVEAFQSGDHSAWIAAVSRVEDIMGLSHTRIDGRIEGALMTCALRWGKASVEMDRGSDITAYSVRYDDADGKA